MTAETRSPPEALDAAARALSRVVPGRACGTCTLCCKVIAVADFDKLPGVWCPHCVRGKGCGIYETRPTDCRTFFCEWMLTPSLGPEWKPERSKFALVMGEGGHLTAAFAHRLQRYWELREFEGIQFAVVHADEDELADSLDKLRRGAVLNPAAHPLLRIPGQ